MCGSSNTIKNQSKIFSEYNLLTNFGEADAHFGHCI